MKPTEQIWCANEVYVSAKFGLKIGIERDNIFAYLSSVDCYLYLIMTVTSANKERSTNQLNVRKSANESYDGQCIKDRLRLTGSHPT